MFCGRGEAWISALYVNMQESVCTVVKTVCCQAAMPPLPPPTRNAQGVLVPHPAPKLDAIKHLLYLPKIRRLLVQFGHTSVEWIMQIGVSNHPDLPPPLLDMTPFMSQSVDTTHTTHSPCQALSSLFPSLMPALFFLRVCVCVCRLCALKHKMALHSATYCRIRNQLFLGGSGGACSQFDHAKTYQIDRQTHNEHTHTHTGRNAEICCADLSLTLRCLCCCCI